jgi:hypothetical protein
VPRSATLSLQAQGEIVLGRRRHGWAFDGRTKTASTAKDTFSTVMPSLGSWGCVFIFQASKSTPIDVVFRLHSIKFNSTPQTGENW